MISHIDSRTILRRAFTLVELLVVISIIGVLMGLLLPAVQNARERGRQAQCSNNLRNIGVAFLNHESQYRRFPDGGEDPTANSGASAARSCGDYPTCTKPNLAGNQNWGWGYQILPFIEQEPLWKTSPDAEVPKKAVPIYFCPTRRRPSVINDRARLDYAGNAGTARNATVSAGRYYGDGQDGVVTRRGIVVSLYENRVRDGASNTLMVAEKCMNIPMMDQGTQAGDNDGFHSGWDCDIVRWGTLDLANTTRSVPPQSDYKSPEDDLHNFAFGSSHTGTFNAVFCDGSLHSLMISVDPKVFHAICTRSGSESDDISGL